MSDAYRNLEEQIRAIDDRTARVKAVIAELESLLADIDATRKARQLELDALRYEGDSENV